MTFLDDPVPPQFADREQIIVVGFARSGSHWLCRLLADVLDSPFASTMQDNLKYAEGLDRPGKYVIRQRHWREKHEPDAKYVYIYRDPRDVVVSMMYFWKQESIEQTLHLAAKGLEDDGNEYVHNRWDFFMKSWFDSADEVTNYERLYHLGINEMMAILMMIDAKASLRSVKEAYERQSFGNRKKADPDSPILRKGIVGDWHSHFSHNDARIAASYFNFWLLHLGYETATDWFEEVGNDR